MKAASFLSIIRHLLGIGGGYLVGKGILDEGTATELVGSIMGLLAIFAGIWDKRSR